MDKGLFYVLQRYKYCPEKIFENLTLKQYIKYLYKPFKSIIKQP